MKRRDFLKAASALAAWAASSQWQAHLHLANAGALALRPDGEGAAPNALPSKEAWLVANRLMFGPRPEDAAHIEQIGTDAFIEEQLAHTAIDDSAFNTRLAAQTQLQDTLTLSANDLYESHRPPELHQDLAQATLLRAAYSRRQLFEVVVDFWTNHFNIFFNKNGCPYLKPVDDRAAMRPYALGKFRDLLGASAHSPAMMAYLDNNTNKKRKPNENYGRELMELHTLGVDGGYTQQDVLEVARAFTGWTYVPLASGAANAGEFSFTANQHDEAAKIVLGTALPANGGSQDAEKVMDLLASHANCATFISTKLARRFVADTPPASVVQTGAQAFAQSKGDIKATLGAILHSTEFKQSFGQKMKRPLEYIVSALRATLAESNCGTPVHDFLELMGQPLFQWNAPNGYPDVRGAWGGASVLLARWNFATALAANAMTGTTLSLADLNKGVDALAAQLLGLALPAEVKTALAPFEADPSALMALLIASPQFQMRG